MTKNNSNKDPLFEYFGELGMEDSKINLEDRILQRINQEKEKAYKPVIPKNVMNLLILGFFAAFIGILILAPGEGNSNFPNNLSPIVNSLSLPKLALPTASPEFTQAIIGFGFFVMIWIFMESRRKTKWI